MAAPVSTTPTPPTSHEGIEALPPSMSNLFLAPTTDSPTTTTDVLDGRRSVKLGSISGKACSTWSTSSGLHC